jgi:hypothetical protein
MTTYFDKKSITTEDLMRPVYSYTGVASRFPATSEIGLEVELEGFGASRLMEQIVPKSSWRFENDPSLRGDCGELVLSTPIKINNLDGALEEFDKMVRNAGFKPSLSRRCSLHVHIDFSHKPLYSLVKFLTLYAILEPHFFEAVAKQRKGNQFCIALSESDLFVSDIAEAIQERKFHKFSNEMRYMACNLSALNKFGSVELRMHRGTADTSEIKAWTEALYELASYANKNYDHTPAQYLEQLSMLGFKDFVSKTFPKCWGLIKDVYETVPYRLSMDAAQDIAYCVSWENAPKGVSVEPKKSKRGRPGPALPPVGLPIGVDEDVVRNEQHLVEALNRLHEAKMRRVRGLPIGGDDPERPF